MGGHLSHLEREPSSEILDASCGPIRGNIYRHADRQVAGYLGIPYAQPPQRFQKPVAAERWTNVRDCYKYGPRCPPSGVFFNSLNKNFNLTDCSDEQNCLTLNVFAPMWKSEEFTSQGRPVMVFIHGGGFEWGSSRDYCDYSLSGSLPLKDVILVTINYRLGALGFMTTGDSTCPGNFGLWDQTMALQWVHNHISSFGGDPDNVTIFGQSAGGASVDFLSLSPHSRHLFKRLIPMSGNAFCDVVLRTSDLAAKVSLEHAKHFGYEGTNESEDVLEWYKSKQIVDISMPDNFKMPTVGFLSFTPNLDGDFLPKSLEQLRKDAESKEMMMGVAQSEGLMFAFSEPNLSKAEDLLRYWIDVYYGPDSNENVEEVRKQIFDYYTSKVDLNNESEMQKALVEFTGDAFFNNGTILAARISAKYENQVYFYVFDYHTPQSFGAFAKIVPYFGSTHCSDVRYILGEGMVSKFEPTEEDLKMLDRMTDIYSNFAKHGDPKCSEWQPYSLDHPGRHYHIGFPKSEMQDEYQKGRWRFFDENRKDHKIANRLFYGTD